MSQPQPPSLFASDSQTPLPLTAIGGLDLVHAHFERSEAFSWELFAEYDSLRVVTYSVSIPALLRMISEFSFCHLDCVFGSERLLGSLQDVIAFQQVAIQDTWMALKGMDDDRKVRLLAEMREGRLRLRVAQREIVHAKIYLLEAGARHRVIVGSANLSETALSGTQSETLIAMDDDKAWDFYGRQFNLIWDRAAADLPVPPHRFETSPVELADLPILNSKAKGTVFIVPDPSVRPLAPHVQADRILRVKHAQASTLSPHLPPVRQGRQNLRPQQSTAIRKLQFVETDAEANNPWFSLNPVTGAAHLTGTPLDLNVEDDQVRNDVVLLTQFFANYESAFVGDTARLQDDYFILMSWLYFSPFMCDLRTRAAGLDEDVVRFPAFAIVYGKSNCGKTSLIDTLMVSMFGAPFTVDKSQFTKSRLRALQGNFKRYPVVFDDVARTPFNSHGKDMIKDEHVPPEPETPGFILSMNMDPTAFPDEIMKRALMVYTTSALPPHDEERRMTLQGGVRKIRADLTTSLYRRYLIVMQEKLAGQNPLPDWMDLSSTVLSDLFTVPGHPPPRWCHPITWSSYASRRYDRVRNRLRNVLRPGAYVHREGSHPQGWTLDQSHVIVWEPVSPFGQTAFNWEDVPSTLIHSDETGRGRTVLERKSVEEFLGTDLCPPSRPFWTAWSRLPR